MSELLSCPFCGGIRVEIVGYFPFVRCKGCGAETDNYNDEEAAAEAWNARVERTCHIVPMDAAGNPPYRTGNLMLDALSDGCSECGYPFDTLNHGVPNYCPNCGAKVVE